MTWHFNRSPHTLDLIGALPIEGQFALLDLIERLEQDPEPIIYPYGIDDGLTRTAVFGDHSQGLIVLLVNADTGLITPVQINWQND